MASRGKGKKAGESAKGQGQGEAAETEKLTINKWDGAAVKNALDDTAKKIMVDDFECVEDFKIVDRRLFLCTLACAFSAFALVYDYLFPFPHSKVVLAVCAICYFLLMGVLSLYSVFCEGSVFMLARHRDAAGVGPELVWALSSSLPRFSHNYSLSVTCSSGNAQTSCRKLEKSVTEWFDEEGTLAYDKFYSDFTGLCKEAAPSKKMQ